MTVITIDRLTGDKLRKLSGTVQLRDERGFVLGEFRPVADRSVYAGIESTLSEEELRRREEETEVFDTAETLRRLGPSDPAPDEATRSAALRRMVERMRRADVAAEAFPITRETLHERR